MTVSSLVEDKGIKVNIPPYFGDLVQYAELLQEPGPCEGCEVVQGVEYVMVLLR
jgi:hypothetical protein